MVRIGQQTPAADLMRQVQASAQQPTFEQGEVINATVVAQEGDTVLLRTEDGKVFQAKLMTQTLLGQSDQVECMVAGKDGQRVQLQLISIVQSGGGSAASQPTVVARENPLLAALGMQGSPQATSILSFLEQMGVRPSEQMMRQAMGMLQESGLDAKGVAFFIANDIPATQENVQAYQQLAQGETAGPILDELIGLARQLEGQQAQQPVPQQETPQAQQPAAQPPAQEAPPAPAAAAPATAEQAPVQALPPEGNPSAPVEVIPDGQAAIPQETAAVQPQPVQPETPALQQSPAPDVAAQAQQPAPAVQADQPQAMQAQQAEPPMAQEVPVQPETLSQRLLSFFLKLDGQTDGAKLKQAVDQSRQMGLLKEFISTVQGGGRDALAPRMADVAAQARLTQDISRFYCVHIPVSQDAQDRDTAELYVYRQKRQDKGIDPENTAILIALGTQTMGRVETLLRVDKRNLSLNFRIQDETAIPMVRKESQSLYGAFSQIGYTLTDARVAPLEVRTTPANAQEVLTKAVHRPRVLLDRLV